MKPPLSSLLITGSIAILGACNLFAETSSLQDLTKLGIANSETTTIFLAKEFITMDENQPKAEAVAVRNGKFIAVGSLLDVKKAAGNDAKVINTFADKTIIAGLIEQHVHPVLAALTMNTNVISIEDWDSINGFSPAVRDPKATMNVFLEQFLSTPRPHLTRHSSHGVTTIICMVKTSIAQA